MRDQDFRLPPPRDDLAGKLVRRTALVATVGTALAGPALMVAGLVSAVL